ncbi:MAG: hypothetical protein HOP35_03675 [Nitrospira sp.]|nr:hypothetical protein [Nitrospira sp.]
MRVFYQQLETRPRLESSLIFLILLLLVSCTHHPRVDDFETSIGQLTQSELTRQFGYPQRLKRLSNGAEAWEYEFLSGQSRCVGYRVYFDTELRSQKWESIACR